MLQLVSLGHRTGLFNHMADGEPVSCSELARRSKMNERYVREWLGGLAVWRFRVSWIMTPIP